MMASVRRMTKKASTISLSSKNLDSPLRKAESHQAGFPAKLQDEPEAG